MRLSFHGAAGEVTGSCYLLEVGPERGAVMARVLIDCGMFQGTPDAARKNWRPLAFDPGELDAVVLTHAHIDHAGRLPVLTRAGYRKRIYCTPPTVPLCQTLLRDAAKLQSEEVARLARARQRTRNRDVILEPLFTIQDVDAVMQRLSVVRYGQLTPIARGVSVRFTDAGHILGSGSLEVHVHPDGNGGWGREGERVIVFSGDLGERGMPLLPDPTPPQRAAVLVLESTYGDRDHRPLAQTQEELLGAVREGIAARGMILMPAFAVGRTQTLIYELNQLLRAGKIPAVPVFVDSPMATTATRLYEQSAEYFDDEAVRWLREEGNPLRFPGLQLCSTADESRALNHRAGPAIIIAGAGMCTGGRILHHLRHHVYKKTTHVIIAGFQAEGTLGRRLVNGEKTVRIFGEPVSVEAKIHTIGGLSAHAGQSTLVAWCGAVAQAGRTRLYLTHGENRQRAMLAERLWNEQGLRAELPMLGDAAEV